MVQFNSSRAADAYDAMVAKANREIRETISLSIFVVVVCAGWNAEANQIVSMRSLFARSVCFSPRLLWLSSDGPTQIEDCEVSMTRCCCLCQKCCIRQINSDHQKLQSVNRAALPIQFQRWFYDDAICEKYILGR